MSLVVVADSSPIRYLVLCEAVQVLPQLYGTVAVPPAVLAELRHPNAPDPVRAFAENLPAWFIEKAVLEPWPSRSLDQGEREAITLAVGISADRILMDERAGRREAREAGLTVTGTLGVLEEAHAARLLALDLVLERLLRTNFRATPGLIAQVIERSKVLEASIKRRTPGGRDIGHGR